MTISELVALAAVRSKKTQREMAAEMGHNGATRLSRIAKGFLTPEADEIVYLAMEAHVPPVETLAEIAAAKNPKLAGIWLKLTGAGVSEAWAKEHKGWQHSCLLALSFFYKYSRKTGLSLASDR